MLSCAAYTISRLSITVSILGAPAALLPLVSTFRNPIAAEPILNSAPVPSAIQVMTA
ncbi:hypothetical protein D3C81_2043770 [compost metagenome]